MGDAVVVVVLLLVIGLVAWPSARRWLSQNRASRLVDPDQQITVDSVDGMAGVYEMNYRPRRMARGRRRHRAPEGAVVHRRDEPLQKDRRQ